MRRLHLCLTIFAACCLALAAVSPAAAAPESSSPHASPSDARHGAPHGSAGKAPKARITWTVTRVEQTISPGGAGSAQVTLSSTADVDQVAFSIPGGLGRVTKIENAPTRLKAGVPVTITLRFTIPAEGAQSQGGVIKVQAGRRNLPANLPVQITVPGAPDDDDTSVSS